MNMLQLSARYARIENPSENGRKLCYYLIPFPARGGMAWSLLAVDEEEDVALATCLLYDLTSDEETAERCLRLCAQGQVLPEELEEVVGEILTEG